MGGWRGGGVLGFVRPVKEREREQEISFDGLPVFNFECSGFTAVTEISGINRLLSRDK